MAPEPFHFFTRQNLTYLTGRTAGNLQELLDGIKEVSSASIYCHTHNFLEGHDFLLPAPPNDFAYWITHMLQDDLLGEEIASIDLREFLTLRAIREKIINTIEYAIKRTPGLIYRQAPEGEEFYFMKAQTFVFPTPCVANNLAEFKECLSQAPIASIYYHMFEAPLRLHQDSSDFSLWLRDSLGEKKLAKKIMGLDPYTQSLENLRYQLVMLVTNELPGK